MVSAFSNFVKIWNKSKCKTWVKKSILFVYAKIFNLGHFIEAKH